jgi:hypothetical protein
MPEKNKPLLILVAGPYRSNTGDDPEKIANNLHVMNVASLELFRLGHIPVTGEALALPLIAVAGSRQIGDENFNEIFHPIARRLIERVDAVLRISGPSNGADEMVALARAAGKEVYMAMDENQSPSAPFRAGDFEGSHQGLEPLAQSYSPFGTKSDLHPN